MESEKKLMIRKEKRKTTRTTAAAVFKEKGRSFSKWVFDSLDASPF